MVAQKPTYAKQTHVPRCRVVTATNSAATAFWTFAGDASQS